MLSFWAALVVLSKVPTCSLHSCKALLHSLLAAIRPTVLTMHLGSCFAVVLECFLKASTCLNLAPALPNSCAVLQFCYKTFWFCQCIPAYPGSTYLLSMLCIVPSIPLHLASYSFQTGHASCYPFLTRVPPIRSMGGYTGSCPSFLRFFPITCMGRHTRRCPFELRVLPVTGTGGCSFSLRVLPIMSMGGHSRRCPFPVRVLPITSPATCPLFVRVLPILSMGHFPSFFCFKGNSVLGLFLKHTRHTGYLVKSSTSVSTSLYTVSRKLFTKNNQSLFQTRSHQMNS